MSGGFSQLFGYSLPDDGEQPEPVQPPWWGPPEDELGVTVPHGTVLARSERGVVALRHVVVYSTGAQFEFLALARDLSRSEAQRLFHDQHQFDPDELPDGFLRLGVELSDGSRASNLGGHRSAYMQPDQEPTGPLFLQRGGGGGMGGQNRVSMAPGYWLWPLPPAGTMRLFCEWPTAGIALSTVELDAGAIRAAAARTTPLWS